MDQAKRLEEIPISYEEKGREIGIELGIEIGRKIGEKIGREETQSRIALNLLRKGSDTEYIAEITMLSRDKVSELKKHL